MSLVFHFLTCSLITIMDYKGANERKETLCIIYFPAFHKTERNTTSDFPSPEVQRGVQIETPIPHPAELPVLVIRGGTPRAQNPRGNPHSGGVGSVSCHEAPYNYVENE